MFTIPQKVFLFSFFSCLMYLTVEAQNQNAPISFGVQFGTCIYQGDLAPSFVGSYHALKPMVSVVVNKPIANNFSLRGSFSKGEISADESIYSSPAWRKSRAFKFNSPLTEVATVLVFDFADQTLDNTGRVSPYLFAGLGLTFLNIHRDWSKLNISAFDPKSATILGLGQDTLHKLPKVLPVIPIGVGLRYTINSRWSMNTELNFRYSFSDYLDGFSKAADPHANDSYYSISFGLNYHLLNNGIKCPSAKL